MSGKRVRPDSEIVDKEAAKPEKAVKTKAEKPEETANPKKALKPENVAKEKAAKPEKAVKPENVAKAKAAKPEKAVKPEKVAKAKAAKPEKAVKEMIPNVLHRRHRLKVKVRLKRRKMYRISLHGDSISKGIIWDEEAQRHKVLADNYATLVGGMLKGNLLNRARFGMTLGRAMTKSIKDLDDLDPKEKPDMVLIEYGGNDCDFDWEAVAMHPDAQHDPKTDIDTFRKLLHDLIARFSDKGILPVVMTLPPLDADRYFAWISRSQPDAARNILSWLGSVNRIYWWQERYNAAILDVAAEMGAHVLDLRGAFLREPDYRTYLCVDGIHPNAEGHRLMARRVGEWLERFCGRMMRGDENRQAVRNDDKKLLSDIKVPGMV